MMVGAEAPPGAQGLGRGPHSRGLLSRASAVRACMPSAHEAGIVPLKSFRPRSKS